MDEFRELAEDLRQKAMFNESQRTQNTLQWRAVAFEQKRISDELSALLDQHAVAETVEVALLRGRLRTIHLADTFGSGNAEVAKRLAELENTADQARQYIQNAQAREHRIHELEDIVAAHAAEQPKLTLVLTEEQVREALLTCVRDISKLQELLREKHGKGFTIPCSTGKLRAANVLHLLTSPVAPPLIEDGNDPVRRDEFGKWMKALEAYPSAASDTRTLLVYKFAERIKERASYTFSGPVAPGEQPPQIGSWLQALQQAELKPPAQERAGDEFDKWLQASEWWDRLLSTDEIRFGREAWTTAAKLAREEALEEAAKLVGKWNFMACSDADGLVADIRALAAQPSPQKKEKL